MSHQQSKLIRQMSKKYCKIMQIMLIFLYVILHVKASDQDQFSSESDNIKQQSFLMNHNPQMVLLLLKINYHSKKYQQQTNQNEAVGSSLSSILNGVSNQSMDISKQRSLLSEITDTATDQSRKQIKTIIVENETVSRPTRMITSSEQSKDPINKKIQEEVKNSVDSSQIDNQTNIESEHSNQIEQNESIQNSEVSQSENNSKDITSQNEWWDNINIQLILGVILFIGIIFIVRYLILRCQRIYSQMNDPKLLQEVEQVIDKKDIDEVKVLPQKLQSPKFNGQHLKLAQDDYQANINNIENPFHQDIQSNNGLKNTPSQYTDASHTNLNCENYKFIQERNIENQCNVKKNKKSHLTIEIEDSCFDNQKQQQVQEQKDQEVQFQLQNLKLQQAKQLHLQKIQKQALKLKKVQNN